MKCEKSCLFLQRNETVHWAMKGVKEKVAGGVGGGSGRGMRGGGGHQSGQWGPAHKNWKPRRVEVSQA